MTGAVLLPVLLVWLILGVLVGYVASQRGRSAVGMFLVSLVFSPIIGFLAVIGLPERERPVRDPAAGMGLAELFASIVLVAGVVVVAWVAFYVGAG